ncbi:sugar isomerase [Cereibacter changlensis JA139]|uniref:Sugar isomerase n=2 Tax=Cereibacter changlensis TaxID=402884 RepID=A0A2T4JPF9_9RHOB|nr:SIS domain-containing protein [Cereibacter changlensis]PTE19810.1 sugar isomerase [Cereibacter changlensis JA139]PZX56448.1 fructoselysine-6-phosphate deglycase [Cereibacter changlensis]
MSASPASSTLSALPVPTARDEGVAGPGFDSATFLRVLHGAIDIAGGLRPLVRQLRNQGISRAFFIGSGGEQLLTLPATDLLRRAGGFPVEACVAAQVVLAPPTGLDRSALAVIPSLSGSAPETLALLAFLQARGVTTLALIGEAGSPLALQADHARINPATPETAAESVLLQTLGLALALLAETGRIDDCDALTEELQRLPALLVAAKRAYEPEAARRAATLRDEPYHIVTGAGSVWAVAEHFGMRQLEQRLRVLSRPVHAADFFHGTLELVEPGVSIFLLKGEDAARPLSDRVERFAYRYTDKLWVLDAARVELPGLSPRLRGLISPVILASLLERLCAHLEALRATRTTNAPTTGAKNT